MNNAEYSVAPDGSELPDRPAPTFTLEQCKGPHPTICPYCGCDPSNDDPIDEFDFDERDEADGFISETVSCTRCGGSWRVHFKADGWNPRRAPSGNPYELNETDTLWIDGGPL